RFVPAAALQSDLSDGGYRPGTRYEVVIAGFPRPDSVRGVEGEPLRTSCAWSFRTVSVSEPRNGLIFDDRMQDKLGLLRLFPAPAARQDLPYVIGTDDSIYLACDKPLDPTSVHDEDFELVLGSPARERIAVRARLVENQPTPAPRPRHPALRSSIVSDNWEREQRAALLELTP